MEIVWSRPAQETLTAILKYIENNFDSNIALKVIIESTTMWIP